MTEVSLLQAGQSLPGQPGVNGQLQSGGLRGQCCCLDRVSTSSCPAYCGEHPCNYISCSCKCDCSNKTSFPKAEYLDWNFAIPIAIWMLHISIEGTRHHYLPMVYLLTVNKSAHKMEANCRKHFNHSFLYSKLYYQSGEIYTLKTELQMRSHWTSYNKFPDVCILCLTLTWRPM